MAEENKQIAKNIFFNVGSFGENLFISFFSRLKLISHTIKELFGWQRKAA